MGQYGHMTIAQVAWNGLTSDVRAKVSQLLRLNPQYTAWTVNAAANKRDQIAFLRASIWADFIKNDPRYKNDGTDGGNRPPPGPEAGQNIGYSDLNRHRYWHFIDRPFSVDATTTEDPPVPNAQTQIALFRQALESTTASYDVKSYDIAWLLT